MKNTWCVLLVEDDAVLGPLTLNSLNWMGHDATLANTATIAYQCLSNKHHFEIMLLDLHLGDERGEDIVHRLRSGGVTLPRILILSANPQDELARSSCAVQAHGNLQKPATIKQIQHSMIHAMA